MMSAANEWWVCFSIGSCSDLVRLYRQLRGRDQAPGKDVNNTIVWLLGGSESQL